MKTHEKKIAKQWFDLHERGLKDWELRVNDCDYQVSMRIFEDARRKYE